jgi:DNA-binding transcriptional ArsR family regulator
MAGRAPKDALFEQLAVVAKALTSGWPAEQGERTVDDLAGQIGQSVANISQHLRVLARSGLVVGRRDGNRVRDRLTSDWVGEL